ncbi:MAG: hypothetical protein HKN91_02505 [Acidimicrobiia bacterium]|nr:hypothetical protein [Acidimicrobiia bacterium]
MHMPIAASETFVTSEAHGTALDVADRLGYRNDGTGTVVPLEVPGQITRLRVDVTKEVPTFFMRVFGMDSVTLSRDATAEYIKPLPLGSPENQFGNDPGCAPNILTETDCAGFWGNIHGKYTNNGMGDAYSSYCDSNNGLGCPINPLWREDGYVFAIDVPVDTTLTIDIVDPAFVQGGGNSINAGDNPILGNPGPTTRFTLYERVDFLSQSFIGTPECQTDYPPEPVGTPFEWRHFCTVNVTAGTYPLRVEIEGEGFGLNRWSLRATSPTAQQPSIFAVGDMSIYANVIAGGSEFFLAEVTPANAGKTMEIDLFDPGEANGDNEIRIVDPDGNSPPCHLVIPSDGVDQDLAQCIIDTTRPAHNYHDDWLFVEIDLPSSYTCTDCWWKIVYDYEGNATDTTTWTARMRGNPIRLLP